MRFVWHDTDLPCAGVPVIVKTNYVSYFIGVFSCEKWHIKIGKKYSEADKYLSASEKITGWAYIGGES